ncbi:MAG: hypothetical protein OEW22_14695, partial [Rubrivivax sp.]|nr:hypothetical protein [Rubrivivax sp.]
RLAAYVDSLPPALLDRPQLRLDGQPLSPREAVAALASASAQGRRLEQIVAAEGIVALLRPDEARFRKAAAKR